MSSIAPKDVAGKPASYLIDLDGQPGAALLAASVRDYRLMSRNKFPGSVKITNTAGAWRLSEVTAWVDSRERGACRDT
jgi:hypothetical protein